MAVDILMQDGHPVKFGESFTVTALPFDALFRLAAAARVAVVGNKAAVPVDIFSTFHKTNLSNQTLYLFDGAFFVLHKFLLWTCGTQLPGLKWIWVARHAS